jgi:hypothetical protein
MPDLPDEVKLVFRGKKRPVLVIGNPGIEVEAGLRVGGAKFHTNRTLQVAPYYGAETWKPPLVARIQRCAYPQFSWDSLPIRNGKDSVLRLDHVQPIGNHGESYELTDYELSEDALTLIDEQLTWLRTGHLDPESLLANFRREVL